MKKRLLLTLFASLLIAENKNINFRHITVDKDGLSESSVRYIFQDSNGFIWITTDNGLDKYDGYSIKQYQYLHDDSTSISQGQGDVVFEDKKGNIWISTSNGNINRLNPETEKFDRFPVYQVPNAQLGGSLGAMDEDASGHIWCRDAGLVRINTKTGERKYFYPKDSTYTKSFYYKVDTLEKRNALIAGIKTPGNSVDSTITFSITTSKKSSIFTFILSNRSAFSIFFLHILTAF
mgnify:CR=1 FL=1